MSEQHYADVGMVQLAADKGRWRIHLRYDDGDIFVSIATYASRKEVTDAIDKFVLEHLENVSTDFVQ